MKKALILGGSGGLSGTLAEMAKERYDEVWTLTRGRNKVGDGLRQIIADREDDAGFRKGILEAGTDWDVVFDCICMKGEHARQDLEVLSGKTNRLVVISTDSVYASERKKVLQTEEGVFVDEITSKFEIPEYAKNKREMEKVFEAYFAEHGRDQKESMKITLFRPGHIYGPRFLFGCYPMQSRQKDLTEVMKSGRIRLVGGGCYLFHPIYAGDLAGVMLDSAENEKTYQQIFCIGGPEVMEYRAYYEQLAEVMKITMPEIEEIPLTGFLEKYPEYYGHLCHRAYDLTRLRETGVSMPSTSLRVGLQRQYEYWKQR